MANLAAATDADAERIFEMAKALARHIRDTEAHGFHLAGGDLSLWPYACVEVAATFLAQMPAEFAGPQVEALQNFLLARTRQIRQEGLT